MSSLDFSICHYNTTRSSRDLSKECGDSMREPRYDEHVRNLENTTAALLCQEGTRADVYFLGNDYHWNMSTTHLSRTLDKRAFQIINPSEAPGADAPQDDQNVIALSSRFNDIVNHSFEHNVQRTLGGPTELLRHTVTIVTATDSQSNQKFTFVSPARLISVFDHGEAARYYRAIDQCLAAVAQDTIQVIGLSDGVSTLTGGMEAYYNRKEGSFSDLSSAGFQLHTPAEPTKVTPSMHSSPLPEMAAKYGEEVDDHFLVKTLAQTIWQRIKSLFCSTTQWTARIDSSKKPLSSRSGERWDITKNVTDHVPIFLQMRGRVVDSSISQLWKRIKACF